MEPSESPGELKPCREEISALLRENSVKQMQEHTVRTHISATISLTKGQETAVQTVIAEAVVVFSLKGEQGQAHQQGCRSWACLNTPGPVGVNWGW